MRSSGLAAYLLAAFCAAVVTLLLFIVMSSLIAAGDQRLDEQPLLRIAEVVMGSTEIEIVRKAVLPDKPDLSEAPPPLPQPPRLAGFDVDTSISVNFSPGIDLNIQGSTLSASDGEYLPIVKVAPIYPRRAQQRGLGGYCIVSYTVTRTGSVRDPEAVDCQPRGVFDRASVKAAAKFKYKPRIVDGEPVEVNGVRNKFIYKMEQ